MVVVGNSAFLSDFVARSLGQTDGGFFVENLRFVENLIDWVSLDNDMMEIRSRGLVSRRLATVDKSTEMTIEVINYVVPVVALVGLGLGLRGGRAALAGAELLEQRPLLVAEAQQTVKRPPDLEGTRLLQVLTLEIHGCTNAVGQRL